MIEIFDMCCVLSGHKIMRGETVLDIYINGGYHSKPFRLYKQSMMLYDGDGKCMGHVGRDFINHFCFLNKGLLVITTDDFMLRVKKLHFGERDSKSVFRTRLGYKRLAEKWFKRYATLPDVWAPGGFRLRMECERYMEFSIRGS